MTISRVKPDWAFADKLSSDQLDGIEDNTTYALDKRAGETDTLESVVSCSGAGRIVQSFVAGANANTTYLVSGGNSVIRIPSTITADREYSLSGVDTVTGDVIYISVDPALSTARTVTVKYGVATLFTLGTGDAVDGQWASFVYSLAGGWELYQSGQGTRSRSTLFTSNGSWTCPRGVTEILLYGVGAGGGGGGGAGTDVGASDVGCSGAGGGGAKLGVMRVPVTAGTTYTVTCGTAGAGGAAGAVAGAGGDGADGGDTTFSDGVTTYTFRGAGGGKGGAAQGGNDYAPGGLALRNGLALSTTNTLGSTPGESVGGWGYWVSGITPLANAYTYGGPSPIGAGGASGAFDGGIGGGGGGMSGFVGAVPGIGGDSALDTVGEAGTAGTLGAGGGGGATGGTIGSDRAGGAGGAGGAGALRIVYVK